MPESGRIASYESPEQSLAVTNRELQDCDGFRPPEFARGT